MKEVCEDDINLHISTHCAYISNSSYRRRCRRWCRLFAIIRRRDSVYRVDSITYQTSIEKKTKKKIGDLKRGLLFFARYACPYMKGA